MTSKKQAPPQRETFNFEEAQKQLESIVELLEGEDYNLANSMKVFEDGLRLARLSQEYLEQTEQTVRSLLAIDGDPSENGKRNGPNKS